MVKSLRPLTVEGEESVISRLISLNKNESVPGKTYRSKVGGLHGSLKDNTISIKSAIKVKIDNPISMFIDVGEYQKAAIESANRNVGILRLLWEKGNRALDEWVENSPNERVKCIRKFHLHDGDEQFIKDVETLVEKLLAKAKIEALDDLTLFRRGEED